jgi:bacillithiol biosynthesis deacetylase BshB1
MAKILVVGPHPDDQEIGMGGTIALLIAQGHDVLLCDMTDGCPTPVGDRPTRLAEAAEAAKVLGVKRVLLDLPNRRVQHTLEARHMVAGLIRAHQATIVFCPHPEDAHPDHLATTRIVEDARFDAKLTKIEMPTPPGFETIGPPLYPKWLFYYYCSHLRRMPDPTFLIDTTKTHEAKIRSILAYKSQFIDHAKNQGVVEWLRAQDLYLGSRIGCKAAEGFYTKEPLGLTGLEGLCG